jgi:hypothetical protein
MAVPERVKTQMKRLGITKVNTPKATPSHKTKSHATMVSSGGKDKLVRFGQKGVKGSPKKECESESYRKRRESFMARHKSNIKKGPFSAAYQAAKHKW